MIKIISGENANVYEDKAIIFPENSLHPNTFQQYCTQLIRIGKVFNITIISFNPAFIEMIDALKDYYDVSVKYYLNDEEIPENELYKLYNNLGDVYHQIDIIRLRTQFEKEED